VGPSAANSSAPGPSAMCSFAVGHGIESSLAANPSAECSGFCALGLSIEQSSLLPVLVLNTPTHFA
jgi:hypothetical protein